MAKYGINQIGFQNSATPIAEGIIDLHDYIMFYILIVFIFVFWIYFDIFLQNVEVFNFQIGGSFFTDVSGFNLRRLYFFLNKINHATNLEIVWTLLPSLILITIAIPSLSLLYSMDELFYPIMTLKVTGLQWYWAYEYSDLFITKPFIKACEAIPEDAYKASVPAIQDAISSYRFSDLCFESYMIPDSELNNSEHHRLLSVDNMVVLPEKLHVRVLVTGADVLHSWAIPSLGIKIDAVPGRLNQVAIFLKRTGIFYGQCSELCGVNHGFMPIVIKSVELSDFNLWVSDSMAPLYKDFIADLIKQNTPMTFWESALDAIKRFAIWLCSLSWICSYFFLRKRG